MDDANDKPRQCTAATDDGSPCRAYAIRGSDPPRCIGHCEEPDVVSIARAGRSKGGRNAARRPAPTLPCVVQHWSLRTPEDVALFQAWLPNAVLAGELGLKEAYCLGQLASQLVKTQEVVAENKVWERLRRLERLESYAAGRLGHQDLPRLLGNGEAHG
jgi:hypothetical protein